MADSRNEELSLFLIKDMLNVTSLTPRPKEAKFPNNYAGPKLRLHCSAGNNGMSSGK
jgi:hypothetical protein